MVVANSPCSGSGMLPAVWTRLMIGEACSSRWPSFRSLLISAAL